MYEIGSEISEFLPLNLEGCSPFLSVSCSVSGKERKRKKALRIRNFRSSLKYLLLFRVFFFRFEFEFGFGCSFCSILLLCIFFLSRKKFNLNGKIQHQSIWTNRAISCCYLQLMLSVEFLDVFHSVYCQEYKINSKKESTLVRKSVF